MSRPSPVRRIGVQSRSITGRMPDGNVYESSLERDFIELLRLEPDYESYYAQPVWVRYQSKVSGQIERYPPDGLVRWKGSRKPLLVEIKFRADIAGKWKEVLPKWRAARAYARSQGWDFEVVSEDQIRIPRLKTCRFLWAYSHRRQDEPVERLIARLVMTQASSPNEIARLISEQTGKLRADVLPQIWRMLAQRQIHFDWDAPLTMESRVWL